ncbi:MAG TPA: aldo/keto reductase [Bryobacteraceae bacterium]|nr:aldo/keto reductase [Bryobacteraceae bacterium]
MQKQTRRMFLEGVTGTLSAASAQTPAAGTVPYRTLGATGVRVSLVGLGGSHIGEVQDEKEAIRIIRAAIDSGVNFMDNSWDYHGGRSEIVMGKALRDGYREKAFLMTKADGRTRQAAARQLDESLKRLETDHLDLWQFHEVIRFEDPDRIFGDEGAIQAALDARKAGKVRFIGFTGHKDPHIHLYMLQVAREHGFRFDTVQMPLNVMDAHFRSFEHEVLPVLVRENIGVLGMKSMGSGVILESKTATPVECLHYAMNLPVSVVITGIDSQKILDQALAAARGFRPMPAAEVAALLRRTAPAAAHGKYELFKTTAHFDSTAQNPQWLGPPSPETDKLVTNSPHG